MRTSDWEGTVRQKGLKEGKSRASGIYTLLAGALLVAATVQATYFKTADAAKTGRTLVYLSSVFKHISSPSFPLRKQSEIRYFGSGQTQCLRPFFSFIYQKLFASYLKRTENGNLSNKLLSSLGFSAQQLFSPEVNLL